MWKIRLTIYDGKMKELSSLEATRGDDRLALEGMIEKPTKVIKNKVAKEKAKHAFETYAMLQVEPVREKEIG